MRRLVGVLVAYALVAWFALQVAEWLRGVLALPPMFRTLVTGLILAGVPVALLVAWFYPDMGLSEGAERTPSSDEVRTEER